MLTKMRYILFACVTVLFEIPFYVYVNDRQSQYLSDFKFMIDL